MKGTARTLAAMLTVGLVAAGCTSGSSSDETDLNPKPPTEATIEANEAFEEIVARFDEGDIEAASADRIAELPDSQILSDGGEVVWDSDQWDFLEGDAPTSVNPSLWRLQKLNAEAGLFKVAEGIYQFRGYDMANMILIEGDTGWIVADATSTAAPAKAGLELAMKTLNSTKPVVAVIYSHTHADHYGGVRGVVDEADVTSGKVKIYAPEDFLDYAVAENVLAGNAMSRRAQYQFGMALPPDPQGSVGTGLGLSISNGSPGFIPPTDYVTTTGEEITIDGVKIQFQMAQNTEAPAEMMFYFPEQKALCVAEVANQLMHNVYTIRGAAVRDSLNWSKVLNESLDLFPDAEIAFGMHHWPVRGKEKVRSFLETQRDTYRFIHDRALNLANRGETMTEIANEEFLPEGLAATASSRGYYGTLSHNLRAVYQSYLGFYDANPATLDPLPRAESAKRYVDAMGGEDAVLEAGRKAFEDGDYKWVVELVNNAVFANPDSEAARALQADALEQLGYQAEAATWRNAYLMGAAELRNGKKDLGVSSANADSLRGMSNELLFDFIGLRLNHEETDGVEFAVQMEFTDSQENWALEMSNSVLNSTEGRVLPDPDLKVTLTRPAFLSLAVAGTDIGELVESGAITIEGDPSVLAPLVGAGVDFDPLFSIVTPPSLEVPEGEPDGLPPVESLD
jgi:alkyl sulfatase BDS1-like metallo-beta-lactamase superfamily hydrolase